MSATVSSAAAASAAAAPITESERTRSTAEEEALDRRIEEIQRKNRQIEERQKVRQEEARENGVPKPVSQSMAGNDDGRLVKNESKERRSKKISGAGIGVSRQRFWKGEDTKTKTPEPASQWSREWDAGKLPADQWRMNVPNIDDARPSSSGNGRMRSSRFSHSRVGDGKVPTTGNRQPRVQRSELKSAVKGVGESVNSAFAARPMRNQRNPGFYHDDRFSTTDNNGDFVTSGDTMPVKPRKSIMSRVTIKNRNGEVIVNGRSTTKASVDDTKGQTSAQHAPRLNKLRSGKDSREFLAKSMKNRPAGEDKTRHGRETRGRNGGGARRTSAQNDEDEHDESMTKQVGEKRRDQPSRRRSNLRVEVRRCMNALLHRVCVIAGDPPARRPPRERLSRRENHFTKDKKKTTGQKKEFTIPNQSNVVETDAELSNKIDKTSDTLPDNQNADCTLQQKNASCNMRTESALNNNQENTNEIENSKPLVQKEENALKETLTVSSSDATKEAGDTVSQAAEEEKKIADSEV